MTDPFQKMPDGAFQYGTDGETSLMATVLASTIFFLIFTVGALNQELVVSKKTDMGVESHLFLAAGFGTSKITVWRTL